MQLVPRNSFTGLLLAPTVWFAFFLLAYLVTGTACTLGYAQETVAGMNIVRVLVVVAGIVAGLVMVIAGVQAWQQWRDGNGAEVTDAERHRFTDLVSLVLSGVALVGTLWLMLTILVNPICQEWG